MKTRSCIFIFLCLITAIDRSAAQDKMRGISQSFTFDVTSNDVNFDITSYVKEGKYYALVMGVEDYQDNKLLKLDHPVRDARKLLDVLQRQYVFDTENTTFLKNPKREDIIIALEELAKKVTPSDNVLIFYAG